MFGDGAERASLAVAAFAIACDVMVARALAGEGAIIDSETKVGLPDARADERAVDEAEWDLETMTRKSGN